jgi:hypothetical protein
MYKQAAEIFKHACALAKWLTQVMHFRQEEKIKGLDQGSQSVKGAI